MSFKSSILSSIYGHGRGWAFSAKDFYANNTRNNADVALFNLEKEGKIRKLMRGIYDYPMYSNILKKEIAPDLIKTANAIARKFSWTIMPSGNLALNLLGLSTQIEGKYTFISNGKSKKYEIDGNVIEFKASPLKDFAFKHKETALIVQAIKATSKAQISEDFLKSLASKFNLEQWHKFKRDAKNSTAWIFDTISKTTSLKEEENG
ncbi:MAG: DUF6088 family protein [Opitutales bacterium]